MPGTTSYLLLFLQKSSIIGTAKINASLYRTRERATRSISALFVWHIYISESHLVGFELRVGHSTAQGLTIGPWKLLNLGRSCGFLYNEHGQICANIWSDLSSMPIRGAEIFKCATFPIYLESSSIMIVVSNQQVMCGSNVASYIPPSGALGISLRSLDIRGIFHLDIWSEIWYTRNISPQFSMWNVQCGGISQEILKKVKILRGGYVRRPIWTTHWH